MIKLNLLQKTRAEHGAERTEGYRPCFLKKREINLDLSLSQSRSHQELSLNKLSI
jgi:hypothetical protein